MYYNKQRKKLNLNIKKLEYLNCGYSAKIYRYSEMILKVYNSNTYFQDKIHEDTFDILKNIDNPHLIKLYDYYIKISLYNKLLNKFPSLYDIDLYTAKYYQDKNISILTEDINYLLDNLLELEKLFQIFTDNHLITNDVKRDNSILGTNNIIIIDPDLFRISTQPKSEISIHNKINLLNLFASILVTDIQNNFNNNSTFRTKICANLMNTEVFENTNITDAIYKKLKYVKKPIDYLSK